MNIVNIYVMKETPVLNEFHVNGEFMDDVHSTHYSVYASTDSLSAWIGTCHNRESLETIISENNLAESLSMTLSEIEYDEIMSVLNHYDGRYKVFNTMRIAKL